MSAAAVVLEARGLCVARGGQTILHSIDLVLHAGEAVALVGPNAAGKSTLVRALMGLLPASAGEVRVHDRALQAWSRTRLAREIALVTPEEQGPPSLSVAERVALGRYPHRGPFRPLDQADRSAIGRALEQAGMSALAERRLGTLSAGERQLATLARGLAQEPRVLLLDEPAAHLDVGHQLSLFRVLDDVRACGVAVLAVVHDLTRAAAWAERMVLVHTGRIVAQGAPQQVLASQAAARAFGVRVRAHAVVGLAHALYSFEELGTTEERTP
jgi:iron complex transport system ATP-binding protein